MPLANVFWSCGEDFNANTRVKRLADINTDTQIGGGKFTQDNYTLINIHGPTAIWACALFVILVIIGIVLRVMWTRRRKKMKRVVHRHKAAALRTIYDEHARPLAPALLLALTLAVPGTWLGLGDVGTVPSLEVVVGKHSPFFL